MSLLVPPPEETYEPIGLAAKRIAAYARSVSEAHALGHGPGAVDELWSREFQEKAMQVYTLTIPWEYLINLAIQFKATHRHMTVAATPNHVTHEWFIIAEYLRIASEVILAFAPPLIESKSRPLESATPSVMQFGLLGEIASAAGAAQLESAADAVHDATQNLDTVDNPLTAEEIQALRLVVAGNRIADIANKLGCSPRTLNRRLNGVRDRLGVATRQEATAVAIKEKWLEPGTGPQSHRESQLNDSFPLAPSCCSLGPYHSAWSVRGESNDQ